MKKNISKSSCSDRSTAKASFEAENLQDAGSKNKLPKESQNQETTNTTHDMGTDNIGMTPGAEESSKAKYEDVTTDSQEPKSSPKDQKTCSPDVKQKKTKGGTVRGIETLVRSLYRTHLDLTTVADNKAGMLITINGLIISILLASGGSLVALTENYLYLIPIIILLLSGFISLLYAVVSARPNTDRCCNTTKKPSDFLQGKGNVMYFMDNADLEQHEYVAIMKEVMKDKNQVYKEMFVHVHSMSVVLKNKFSLLRTAYTVFLVGLSLCIAFFIVIVVISAANSSGQTATSKVESKPLEFKQFDKNSGIFEPSGVHQLADGRFIIVQDEADQPLSLLIFQPDGRSSTIHLSPQKTFSKKGTYKKFRILDDLEGVDVDNHGNIYAITSHSEAGSGSQKNREKLSRFQIKGDRVVNPSVVTKLKDLLKTSLPELVTHTENKSFNIEGLALNKTQDKLLLGFRAPLDDKNNALVAVVNNIESLFSEHKLPQTGSILMHLNLNGNGIRGMAYDPFLRGYLIIGGSSEKGSTQQNQLWFWNGNPDSSPRLVLINGFKGIKNAEGVSPVKINGESRILIVSDDGKKKDARAANFLLFDYDKMQIL